MDFRLLFWNLGDRDLSRLLAALAKERDIDFIAVCEANSLGENLVEELKASTGRRFREIEPIIDSTSNKIRFFAERTMAARFNIVHETPTGRLVICRVI